MEKKMDLTIEQKNEILKVKILDVPSIDENFQEIIKTCLDLNILLDYDMASLFKVSKTTVKRWANGKSKPHPLVIEYVHTTLKKLAKARIELIENIKEADKMWGTYEIDEVVDE